MAHALDSTVLFTTRKRLLQDYPLQIRTCLDALSDDQIWWRANEPSNAIGNLVVHLCGSNRFYLVHGLAGREFNRDRDAEFAERNPLTRAELKGRYDAMVSDCEQVLNGLSDADLARETDRTGKPGTTFAQILLHVSHHNAVHMGQIVFATKLLKEGAIQDLWMKTR
jgi:uncharacterized damage-inducible protein DinB